MGQLLLFRPRPKDDELLSSWLVRLAWANLTKVHPFTRRLFDGDRTLWQIDLDRSCPEKYLERLSDATGVPLARAYETTLRGLGGVLFEDSESCVNTQWLLEIKKRGRARLGYAQQYCPLCLSEDPEPYFRRMWRLAFSVVCPKHRVVMLDACPVCWACVAFHTADYGDWLYRHPMSLARCASCGLDLRTLSHDVLSPASDALCDFVGELQDILTLDESSAPRDDVAIPLALYKGLHVLVSAMASSGATAKLRDAIARRHGLLPLSPAFGRYRGRFENLRVGDRCLLLSYVQDLFMDWPVGFVSLAKQIRLSSSYFQRYRATIPYWVEQPIRWALYGKHYSPSEEEWAAAAEWLRRSGRAVNPNTVRKALGVAYKQKANRTS